MNFDEFWLSGPWEKRGKDLARRRWEKTVRSLTDLERIERARDAYVQELREKTWQHPLHGGTWFGRWTEYVPACKVIDAPLLASVDLSFEACREVNYAQLLVRVAAQPKYEPRSILDALPRKMNIAELDSDEIRDWPPERKREWLLAQARKNGWIGQM